MEQPTYQIEVHGRLPAAILDELAGFRAEVREATTVLTGPVADPAALYGLLGRLECVGVALVAVRPVTRKSDT